MLSDNLPTFRMGRRAFVRGGTLALAASAAIGPDALFAGTDEPTVRAGLVTDLHSADKPPAGSRHYRESLRKLREAGAEFQEQDVDFVVELGDLIDAADSVETELGYLQAVNRVFQTISPNRHYVLGNHCVDTLHKKEFLDEVGQGKSFYSFDTKSVHFIVLDACFRSDGVAYGRKNFEWTDPNLSADEIEWLEADLESSSNPVIVFVHQRLDVENNYGIKNAAQVRGLFEASEKVSAVFQGHSHKNDLKEINGIHYCTLVAMVEGSGEDNSGYSILEVNPTGDVKVHGFRKQDHFPR